MKIIMITALAAVAALDVAGCSKKSSSSSTSPSSSGTTSTTTTSSTSSGSVTVSSLSSIPSLDSFLESSSSSLDLTTELGLTTGTPPLFVNIGNDLGTYLAGSVSAIAAQIATDNSAGSWTDMKSEIGLFFDAETKCNIMQDTAHMVERLREDTAGLCLLQAVGPVGNEVYVVESGTPISDLTTVFEPTEADKFLQIGNTDKGQPHYEMVHISGTTVDPAHYHLTYTQCVTTTQKAERQLTLDIDNTTGTISVQSITNGPIDDQGPKPADFFTLVGQVMSSGTSVLPDPSATRTINYNAAGTFGQLGTTEQGQLTITGADLAAKFFANSSGTDPMGNLTNRVEKTALEVNYSGTDTATLVITEGAGRSIMTMTGPSQNGSGTVVNVDDHSIGFDFDDTAYPQYTTETSSTYVTNVAAIDFTTDTILGQTAPTAPDLTKIDDTACTATVTTHLNYKAKPEDNTVYNAAMTSCNTLPAANNASLCNPLIDLEHTVNQGMQARKNAVGSATN